MNCSPNYTEWSREEKEELAKRRMDEMRLKNEKLLQRYAEVENDRIKAESRNSAITGAAKTVKKEKIVSVVESNKEETKVEYDREWDRGKPDMDHWKSPEHHGSSFKNYRSSGRNRRDSDRKDNWGGFSRNENAERSRRGTDDSYEKRNVDRKDSWSGYSRNETTDHYRSDHAPDQRKLRGGYRFKQNDNNQHGSSRPQISPKRTRGVGYRNSDSHRKPQNSYSDDKFRRTDYNRSNSRKKYSYRAHSRSTSRSGSDHVENQFTIRAYNLWQNDKISEDQTKQNRVEKWVKSVNKTNMWGSKEFSPNPKIFAHDVKAKFSSKVPSEQKDKSARSFTKFDRYEATRNKSSEDEYDADLNKGNKSCENSNYASQRDYNETKNQNKGAAYNVGSAKQMGGMKKKGVQTKRSPQYSSGSSTKNENFRKQRRFDGKGQKDDERNRYKSKMHDNTMTTNDSWKNSTLDSTRNQTSSVSKLDNTDTWNQEDDGVWGNTDQSHIKWKLSDEETDVQEIKNQNKKEAETSSDMRDNWNDNQVASDSKRSMSKRQNEGKDKGQVPPDNDDGIWSNVEQSDIRWKTETETFSQDGQNQNWEFNNSNSAVQNTARKETKKETGYGMECEEIDKSNINNSSERKEELITSGQKTCDSGPNESNVSECHSNSATRQQDLDAQESHCDEDTIINSFKRSVCISDEKTISVSVNYSDKPVASDDGGWSTVSEEGEVHSDDANDANKNYPYEKSNTCKKDNCSGCLSTEMIDEYWSDHVPVPRKLKGRDTLKDANTWNQENDVIWSNTDQSHTKWNIRDEKIDVHKAENQNKKKAAKNSNSWYDTWTDTWNDNKVASDSMRSRSKRQNEGKDKGQVPHYNDSCERRNVDRKDTWNKYFRNETTDHCRSDYLSDQRKLRRSYRFKQNDNQHGSNHPKISQKRTRGVGYYNCDSDRKPQTSYSGDKFRRTDYNRSNSRKKYSYRSHSRSTNGSNHVENQFTITAYNLWQNEKISEYQTKQDRVEKWVKSVNKINMWESKEFSSNPKIFAHDIEARFSSKLSLEQKEESTSSFTNLDQYEVNHNKSSEKEYDADLSRGNKSCENSNYASQWDYNETKNQNKDAAYNVGSAKHMGRMKKKGVQTKYSPQYSSVSSTKKENFKKQRFVGKDQKDDERNRYKFKIHDNSMTTNETWKNSTLDSTRNKTTSGSKLGNTDTCNQDDGFWSYTSQSHIKWKISDEEIDVQETKNQNKKKTEMSSDMRNNWNDNQVASNSKKRMSKRQNEEKCKCQVPPDNESDTSKDAYTWNQEDDGLWGNTDQSHIKWNISDEEIDAHEVENQSKKKAANSDSWYDTWTDNWNDNQVVSGSMRSRSKRQNEGKDKHQVPRDNGRNEGNISEYYSNSAARQQNSYAQESYWNEDAIVNSFKCSVYISEGKE